MPPALSPSTKTMPGELHASTICPHCDTASPVGPRSICTTCARPLTVCGGVRLGAEIDRGGVARIHGGRTIEGADAAVKVLERTTIHSAAVHRLFARSARLLSSMAHPGLPRFYGFETNRKRSFLAMERLFGGTLWARVAYGSGKLRGVEIDRLLRALLRAVDHLHARELIHGDITPRNVMFRSSVDPQPVLVDFDGLCTTEERDVASLVMTPGYTAPEQRVGELGPGSDLYGVGATVVFAATGKAPDRLERIGEHMDLDLSAADLRPKTRAVLQRLVALDPLRRPKSARAALAALDSPDASTPIRPQRATPSRSWLGAKMLVAALVALLVFGLAIGLVATMALPPAHPM